MNPIPLSAPDGTVYAYACGRCFHVRAGTSRLVEYDDTVIAELAAFSRDDAERCCSCSRCGAYVAGAGRDCAACWEAGKPERERAEREWQAGAERFKVRHEAALASALDEAAALRLRDEMSDISEFHYCAGWLHDLGPTLWRIAQGGPRRFGLREVTQADVELLLDLSERAGGWWRYDGTGADSGPVFVPIDEWLQRAEYVRPTPSDQGTSGTEGTT